MAGQTTDTRPQPQPPKTPANTNKTTTPVLPTPETKLTPEAELERFLGEMRQLSAKIVEARKEGKPVVLAVGLLHESTEHANMGAYLIALANRHGGLKGLFIESKDRVIAARENLPLEYRMTNPKTSEDPRTYATEAVMGNSNVAVLSFGHNDSLGIDPFDIMQPMAKGLGVRIVGVDTFERGDLGRAGAATSEIMDKRDVEIWGNVIENVEAGNGVYLLALGAMHLAPIMKNAAENEDLKVISIMLPQSKEMMERMTLDIAAYAGEMMWRQDELKNNADIFRVSPVSPFQNSMIGSIIKQTLPKEYHSDIASSLAPDLKKMGLLSNEEKVSQMFDMLDGLYKELIGPKHLRARQQMDTTSELMNIFRQVKEGE